MFCASLVLCVCIWLLLCQCGFWGLCGCFFMCVCLFHPFSCLVFASCMFSSVFVLLSCLFHLIALLFFDCSLIDIVHNCCFAVPGVFVLFSISQKKKIEMKIFVIGSTGLVGKAMVRAAINAKHEVVALVRSLEKAKDAFPEGFSFLQLFILLVLILLIV